MRFTLLSVLDLVASIFTVRVSSRVVKCTVCRKYGCCVSRMSRTCDSKGTLATGLCSNKFSKLASFHSNLK